MEFAIYYTLGGIVLYSATAWILDRVEQARGARFTHRNLIYFVIFFVMAYLMMSIINPPPDALLTPPAKTGTPPPLP